MIQMQLRVPGNQTIEDLISVLSLTVLESMKRELDSMEVPFDSFRALEVRLKEAMMPYVRAFESCGSDPVCTQGIHGKTIPDPRDRIYMLHLPTGLTPLLEAVMTEVLESVRCSLDHRTLDSLHQRMFWSLRRELDQYTYWNPFCGKEEICRSSHPMDPWTDSTPN